MSDLKEVTNHPEAIHVQDVMDAEKSDSLQLEWTEEDEKRIRRKMVRFSLSSIPPLAAKSNRC